MKDFLGDLPFIGDFMEQHPKVAVLRLSGVIADAGMKKGGISHASVADQIDKAFDMKDVREIAVIVNSPGGSPAQSSLIATQIRDRAHDKKVPVTCFVEDVAASGGYWLALAADKIYVQPSSIIGSIGVISASFGLEDFIKKFDVKRRVHTSGKDKAMLDPFLPEKKSDVERLSKLQNEIHAQFIEWVRARRGDRLKGTDEDLFEGQIWTGHGAIGTGLADAIGDMRGVMRDKYGDKVRLIDLEPEKPFWQSMLGIKSNNLDLTAYLENRGIWSQFGL
ncbi:MAG TPA: S49 family peptidase [Alphaproteobacteria bacterium]